MSDGFATARLSGTITANTATTFTYGIAVNRTQDNIAFGAVTSFTPTNANLTVTVSGTRFAGNFIYNSTLESWVAQTETSTLASGSSVDIEGLVTADAVRDFIENPASNNEIKGTYVSYSLAPALQISSGASSVSFDSQIGVVAWGRRTPEAFFRGDITPTTATYSGTIDISSARNTNLGLSGSDTPALLRDLTLKIGDAVATLDGTLDLMVDFSANTIRGTAVLNEVDVTGVSNAGLITNISRQPISGSNDLVFESGSMDGNGFSGTLIFSTQALTALNIAGNATGRYQGFFFGDDAEDLAGVLSFDGTHSNGGAVIGLGGFRGDRQ